MSKEGGAGDHAIFGQKLLTTQHSVGRCARKSPSVKWANALKESSKKFPEADAASHSSASWYSDRDGFLEHSPSREGLYYKGPALQKIIPGFFLGGSPSYIEKVQQKKSKLQYLWM